MMAMWKPYNEYPETHGKYLGYTGDNERRTVVISWSASLADARYVNWWGPPFIMWRPLEPGDDMRGPNDEEKRAVYERIKEREKQKRHGSFNAY